MDTLRKKLAELFPQQQQKSKLKPEEGSRTDAEGIRLPTEPQIDPSLYPKWSSPSPQEKDPLYPREAPSNRHRRDRQVKEEELKKAPLDIDYQMEFINFVDRNAPKGFSKRFMEVLPYLELSFLSWPTFWLWRGYNWQFKRNSEKLGVYIHRTYQQAKAMQFCILATGLLAVSMNRSAAQVPLQINKMDHEIANPTPESVPLAQAPHLILNSGSLPFSTQLTMGLQDFVGSVKEKAQKFSKSRPETSPTPPPPVPNLGEEMRLMVESEPFESGFTASAPFLCASLGAWPGYWLFRALDYHSYRAHIPLPIYIKQTYYQAKVVQLFIIMAGTFTVLRKNRRLRWMPTMEVGKT